MDSQENQPISSLSSNNGNDSTIPKKSKVALITGITGQDGSYLAELLLEKGYTVHGIVHRAPSAKIGHKVDQYIRDKKLIFHFGDLCDNLSTITTISKVRPDEIYNLGAASQVARSFDMPEYTAECNGLGVLRILDAIRTAGLEKTVRFYQASSSELYGKVRESPQTESTPFYPRSPYAVAKQFAFWILVNYREAYGMFLSNGILFNHESPRRGKDFVTRKITSAVAAISEKQQETLYLGNLEAKRDWGHARDYVEGMWRMLQVDEPDDYILATGEAHSVREFVEKAFLHVNIIVRWIGTPGTVEEIGVDANNEEHILVKVDPQFFRPTEVDQVLGNPTKAREKLGWVSSHTFEDLVKEMVDYDLKIVRGEIKYEEH